jgi:hypothetical protein
MNEAGLEPEAATTADVPKAGPAEEGISALAQDAEEPGKTAEAEPTPSTSQLSGMLAEASRQLHDQQPSPQDKLAFEPYHTVDYFASQGIKVQNDLPETNTRFDKQLMSFTQWLRTMKRVNYQSETKAEDPVVTQKANASLAEEDVITEAMAEVLEKQGRLEKASEVYAKLMLLHPEKSHYFAARLNKVKELK